PENAIHDKSFVGKWQGKHLDAKTGSVKKWVQIRKDDGTYIIQFDHYDNKGKLLGKSNETGYWWIEKGLFHEISPNTMDQPESYLYRFMGKDKIKFISAKPNSDYSFEDTRVVKEPPKNLRLQ
ncbi:MAG: hypothetical protein QNJ78_12245, partial [Gammaproteobacteria bacterium]|nr:hypothetical protein [Gammaproteobacteria bacterium]